MASTEKNDFFTFKTRNNGQAVLTNDADTGGLRDMFVLRSHEGDKYYLIATDLKVSSMGWSQNQVNGSRKVEIYESTDMMNWTRTNGDGNGGITINTDSFQVRKNGVPIDLTQREYELLTFLASHPGKVFSRVDLMEQVWNYGYVGDDARTVDVTVRRLREKIGAEHIVTVRGVGYRWEDGNE